ncbi:NAD(P)-binding protein [Hyaloscypha variabilis]
MSPLSPVKTYHTDTYPSIDPTSPRLSAKGKNIVISGGSAGIGREIVQSFAKAGAASISILARTSSTLLETKETLEREYAQTKIYTYIADIVKREQVNGAFEAINSAIGVIDILIANTAYFSAYARLTEADPEDWYHGFEVSVKGNFNLVNAFLPFAAADATVVDISTCIIPMAAMPGLSSYHASKVAALKYFEYVHAENPHLFLIHVHPGCLRTAADSKCPEGTTGIGYDKGALCGDAVVWVVSPEARFLNGKYIWVNWDVDELKAMSSDIEKSDKLTLGVHVLQY